MQKKTIAFLLMAVCWVGLSSCSGGDDDAERRVEYAQIVGARSARDLLDDLYIANDADTDALARILKASPSSIERIRRGETLATDLFEERIRESMLFYIQNDRSFSKLRRTLDPDWSWYSSMTSWIWSPDPIEDDYTEIINPAIKQVQ